VRFLLRHAYSFKPSPLHVLVRRVLEPRLGATSWGEKKKNGLDYVGYHLLGLKQIKMDEEKWMNAIIEELEGDCRYMKGKIDVVERDINKTVDELAGLKRKADKLEERYADIKTAIDVNRSKLKALQLKRAQKEMCIVAEGSEG
jgi:hypothetical protein